ncbi:MAG: sortase [Patescibacteria group bacterium]|nr:sortase [Patescibacteria group bacterium]
MAYFDKTDRIKSIVHIHAEASIANFPSVKARRKKENWLLALTFVQVFMIIQIAMNFDAYQSNLAYTWKNSVLPYFGAEKIVPIELPELGMNISDNVQNELNQVHVQPIDFRLKIDKLEQNVPVVEAAVEPLLNQDWNALEKQIQADLQNGVVHYPATARPGTGGNTVITGHSSYYPWDAGRYKSVFALLEKLEAGDQFSVFYHQKEYKYKVESKNIIKATDVSVLNQDGDERVTLITCWPTGTNYKRLVVIGKPITDAH